MPSAKAKNKKDCSLQDLQAVDLICWDPDTKGLKMSGPAGLTIFWGDDDKRVMSTSYDAMVVVQIMQVVTGQQFVRVPNQPVFTPGHVKTDVQWEREDRRKQKGDEPEPEPEQAVGAPA